MLLFCIWYLNLNESICLIVTKQNGYTRYSEDLKGRFYNFHNLTPIKVWIGSSTRETKLLKGF